MLIYVPMGQHNVNVLIERKLLDYHLARAPLHPGAQVYKTEDLSATGAVHLILSNSIDLDTIYVSRLPIACFSETGVRGKRHRDDESWPYSERRSTASALAFII